VEDEEEQQDTASTDEAPSQTHSDDALATTGTPTPQLPTRPGQLQRAASPAPPQLSVGSEPPSSAPELPNEAEHVSPDPTDADPDPDADAVSLMSSASSTARSVSGTGSSLFRTSLRRRTTDSSASSVLRSGSVRHRSTSFEAREEEEDAAAALGTSLGLSPSASGREGEGWGIGDEVRMGLE
jgi:hypothetical protein